MGTPAYAAVAELFVVLGGSTEVAVAFTAAAEVFGAARVFVVLGGSPGLAAASTPVAGRVVLGGTTVVAVPGPPRAGVAGALAEPRVYAVLHGSTEVAWPGVRVPPLVEAGPEAARADPIARSEARCAPASEGSRAAVGLPTGRAKPVEWSLPPWVGPVLGGAAGSGTGSGFAGSGVHAGATVGAPYTPE